MLLGLCPLIPPDRPAAPALWWIGQVEQTDGDASEVLVGLEEAPTPPPLDSAARIALAAPCSLPAEFLSFLNVAEADRIDLTAKRLLAEGRRFASRRTRGQRHPLRFEAESSSSLERRRLARLHAALPLLRRRRGAPELAGLFEVDTVAVLRRLDLPTGGWTGSGQDAIARRRRIVDALADGALGNIAVRTPSSDFAIACSAALEALLATGMAAWMQGRSTEPDGAVPIPLP